MFGWVCVTDFCRTDLQQLESHACFAKEPDRSRILFAKEAKPTFRTHIPATYCVHERETRKYDG